MRFQDIKKKINVASDKKGNMERLGNLDASRRMFNFFFIFHTFLTSSEFIFLSQITFPTPSTYPSRGNFSLLYHIMIIIKNRYRVLGRQICYCCAASVRIAKFARR